MHVPNMYPFKKKLIESLKNKKKNTDTQKLLEKMQLKSKEDTNIEIFNSESDLRTKNYLKKMENEQKGNFYESESLR